MAMTQEAIDWRYLPYILGLFFRPKFQGISPENMARNVVQYLHFRILKFPLMIFSGKLTVCYRKMDKNGPSIVDLPLKIVIFQFANCFGGKPMIVDIISPNILNYIPMIYPMIYRIISHCL